MLAALQLCELVPSPLIVLEAFGRFWLRRMREDVHLCEASNFYQIKLDFVREAYRFLPPAENIQFGDVTVVVKEVRHAAITNS
ncbi:MAG: hypothetical protein WAU52_06655 [Burkholderiales bacterium]